MKGSWKRAVAFFALIVELSDKVQPVTKPITPTLNASFTHWRLEESNLHKWSDFLKKNS